MSKHTLGPFYVQSYTDDCHVVRTKASAWEVASCGKLENAILFAAAPDMTEALEHSIVALEYIAGELRELGEDEDADRLERQAQENRAVIAKARGEEGKRWK